MGKRQAAALAALLSTAFIAQSYAETPCDVLRSHLREVAGRDPGLTKDSGNGEFLIQAVKPLLAEPDGSIGANCASLVQALPGIEVDRSELDLDATCDMPLSFYNERGRGGFVYLTGPEGGSGGCDVAAILLIEGQYARLQADWDACALAGRSWLLPLRIDGMLYPATVDGHVIGRQLQYGVTLAVPRSADCSLTITYEPHYTVDEWFGPDGKGDIDAALRAALEPLLLERAAGGDGRTAAQPILDHAVGDSVYDAFLRRHSELPITQLGPADPDDLTGAAVYFTDSMYDQLDHPDMTPLRIGNRRLLLAFGFPTFGWRVANDPGFALLEWTGSELAPIAGGYLGKRGENPRIE